MISEEREALVCRGRRNSGIRLRPMPIRESDPAVWQEFGRMFLQPFRGQQILRAGSVSTYRAVWIRAMGIGLDKGTNAPFQTRCRERDLALVRALYDARKSS